MAESYEVQNYFPRVIGSKSICEIESVYFDSGHLGLMLDCHYCLKTLSVGKRPQNLEVRGGAVGVRNRRDHQIAAVYGPSVAAKKPKSAVSRPPKNEDYLEKVNNVIALKLFLIILIQPWK